MEMKISAGMHGHYYGGGDDLRLGNPASYFARTTDGLSGWC
jgi:hypothetical protein